MTVSKTLVVIRRKLLFQGLIHGEGEGCSAVDWVELSMVMHVFGTI